MMRGKPELLMLVIGLVLFMFDLSSDIFVAVQYIRNSEIWWFVSTVIVFLLSIICITIAAQHQMKSDRLNTCLTYTFLSIFRRYHKEFKQWKRTFWDNAPCAENCRKKSCETCQFYLEEKTKFRDYEYKLVSIRYIESMSESAPQWCLQVYIMLRQWYYPWYTVVSVTFSLLSLAWSITAFEKARETREPRHDFKFKSTVILLLWQLSSLVSRLTAVVIFAYVFKGYVFLVLVFHMALLNGVITVRNARQRDLKSVVYFFLSHCLLNVPFVYHSSVAALKWIRIECHPTILVNLVLISLENIVMVILSVKVSRPDAKHMDILEPVAISCVVTGLFLGTIFFVVFYRYYDHTKALLFSKHKKSCCKVDPTTNNENAKTGGSLPPLTQHNTTQLTSLYHNIPTKHDNLSNQKALRVDTL